ncbi:hypothetical protein [Companilactobacillus heilongjiangensis]|uniref:Uncharacterized protein n=1 Tax=Companilactobacillus heilongjiangensis TaxID=1074467 RepID=A0A0K2LEA0_9LACO|nr:hypothetical protein [Companilactobacillus heilongjiangensis]ALB29617.1 hypothetical protein JP39_09770 [Companilactobacillus heilongjiangensis]
MPFENFFHFFKSYSDCYTIIGGNAASILLNKEGQDFRATHDYDMVVIFENATAGFSERFMQFVEKYGYSMDGFGKNKDKSYYRFVTKNESVPSQIELFCRKPFLYDLIEPDVHKTPLHFENGPSLSAIVLDDDYYQILKKGVERIQVGSEGAPVLSPAYLILFKAKAHLDIRKRILDGQQVQRSDKTKHFNDVCRLTELLPDNNYDLSLVPERVQSDLKKFIKLVEDTDKREFKLKFRHMNAAERPNQIVVITDLNNLLPN